MMEQSLLCNEVWLMSPNLEEQNHENPCSDSGTSFLSTKQDCEEAFTAFLAKEARYLPRSTYPKLDHFIRFKAVAWIIKSQTRMALSAETLFGAVNCLDRFISVTQCQGWRPWMIELLSVACLSIAAKFNETSSFPLHQFQEDLEKSFSPTVIQRMEVTVLKALDWKVDCVTPFSYVHLLFSLTIDASKKTLIGELTQRTTQLLLHLLLDPKFMGFKQSVVAVSAVKTVLQDLLPSRNDPSLANLESLIPQDRFKDDDLIHCQRLMKNLSVRDETIYSCSSSPSSPVTVLKSDLFNSFDFGGLKIELSSSGERKRKRKREVEEGL